jgi:hypothetical protein
VDNNRGVSFSPETLLSYKALHEARVTREALGLYPPIGWIHVLDLGENPLFKPDQKVRFAKLNLLLGSIATGKTALSEWVAGAFDCSYLDRWRTPRSAKLQYRLSYLSPVTVVVDVETAGAEPIKYRLDGVAVPLNPIGLRVFRLGSLRFKDGADDLTLLAEALQLPTHVVRNLTDQVHSFPHATVHNPRFVEEDGGVTLYADLDGTVPDLSLQQLSGREMERVFLEFATAVARVAGRYAPTLLILDGCPSVQFAGVFDLYAHHLLAPGNCFQTIMCTPDQNLDLNVLRQNGWEVIQTVGRPPSVGLTQELRSE